MVTIQIVVEAAQIPALHEPVDLTWIIEDGKGRKLTSVTRTTTPGTWFLETTLSGKDLFSCAPWTWSPKGHFYICPAHDSDEYSCGSSDPLYCATWRCEASGHISWEIKGEGLITMYLRGQDSGISMRCKHFVSMNNLYSCKGSNTVYPTLGILFTDKGKRVNWSGGFCVGYPSLYIRRFRKLWCW